MGIVPSKEKIELSCLEPEGRQFGTTETSLKKVHPCVATNSPSQQQNDFRVLSLAILWRFVGKAVF
jgi:hypothetical protein